MVASGKHPLIAFEQAFPGVVWETRTRHVAGRDWILTTVEDQDALLQRVRTDADLANFPYGLLLWPASIGLCEHLTENPHLVQNKRVLEIGAGVGLAGMVTQTLQPAQLVQTDYHEYALYFARENARQNHLVKVTITAGDWRDWPDGLTGFDLVIGSDVLYERTLHDDLARLFPRLLAPGGGQIVLSDPLRPQALSFVERLEKSGQWRVQMDGRRVTWQPAPEQTEEKDVALFTLRPAT